MITNYKVSTESIELLSLKFPPMYDVIKRKNLVIESDDCFDSTINVNVIGHIEYNGLELLVVSINNKSQDPTGNYYSITWSIDSQAKHIRKKDVFKFKRFILCRPIKITVNHENNIRTP